MEWLSKLGNDVSGNGRRDNTGVVPHIPPCHAPGCSPFPILQAAIVADLVRAGIGSPSRKFRAVWRHGMTGKFGCCFVLLIDLMLSGSPAHAMIDQVPREQDIVDLRLGQRVQVDDGTCPQGQIKEVSGARMGSNGIERVRKCIPRKKK